MRSLAANFISIKNAVHSDDPILVLYEIDLDGGTTYARYVSYPESVTFDGNTYNPWPIAKEEIQETSTGDLTEFRVQISNIRRTAQAYSESYDLMGKTVNLHFIPYSRLSTVSDAYTETWKIVEITCNDRWMTMTLGQPSLILTKFPKNRALKTRCNYVFRDTNTCGYPSETFDGCSSQIAAGEGEIWGGWYTLNKDEAPFVNVDQTGTEGLLSVTTNNGTTWWHVTANGLYFYRGSTSEFTGTWDVWGECDSITDGGSSGFTTSGIMARDPGSSGNWIALDILRRHSDGYYVISFRNTYNGTTTESVIYNYSATFAPFIRLAKSGAVFTPYYKVNSGDSWTSGSTKTNTNLESLSTLSLGFKFHSNSSSSTETVKWKNLTFLSGGYATCNRLQYSADGCSGRGFLHRYGAFPGLSV